MENIFETFTITILKLNKLVQKIKVAEMEKYGLKAVHVMCIYYLKKAPEGLTARELTKLTLEDKAAISRALSKLKDCGYITYDHEGYNAGIRLTEEGAILADTVAVMSESAVKACNGVLTDEERAHFYGLLEKIAESLTVYYEKLIKE